MRSPPLTVGIVIALGANAALSASVHLPPATKRGVINSREGAVGRQAAAARLGSCRGMRVAEGGNRRCGLAAWDRVAYAHACASDPAVFETLPAPDAPCGAGSAAEAREGVGER